MAWLSSDVCILEKEIAPECLLRAFEAPGPNAAIAEVLCEKIATLDFLDYNTLADVVQVIREHGGCDPTKPPEVVRAELQLACLVERTKITLPPVSEKECLNLMHIAKEFSAKGLTYVKTGDTIIHATIMTHLKPENASSLSIGATPYSALERQLGDTVETIIGGVAKGTLDSILSKYSAIHSVDSVFLVALYVAIAELWAGNPPPLRIGVQAALPLPRDQTIGLHVFGQYYPETLTAGLGDGRRFFCVDPSTKYFVPSTIIHLLRASRADAWLQAITAPKDVPPKSILFPWTRKLI